jgi:hypothetical protein
LIKGGQSVGLFPKHKPRPSLDNIVISLIADIVGFVRVADPTVIVKVLKEVILPVSDVVITTVSGLAAAIT